MWTRLTNESMIDHQPTSAFLAIDGDHKTDMLLTLDIWNNNYYSSYARNDLLRGRARRFCGCCVCLTGFVASGVWPTCSKRPNLRAVTKYWLRWRVYRPAKGRSVLMLMQRSLNGRANCMLDDACPRRETVSMPGASSVSEPDSSTVGFIGLLEQHRMLTAICDS